MAADQPTPATARLDVTDRIGTIILNRPDKLNALTTPMARELLDAVRRAVSDDRVRALVITGEGRAFCAGGDLNALREILETEDWASARELLEAGRTLVSTLHSMPKPSIAAVNGPAAGAGASLALACDLRIASETASLGLTFSRIGLHPDWGGTYFLPRLVGTAKAQELIDSGEMIEAGEALRLGIYTEMVRGDQLSDRSRDVAIRTADRSSLA